VEDFKSFYPAEDEHQDYYLKHPEEFEKELIESGRKGEKA
jgi:peptide-methionine (S)-S-oxide reductase